MTDSLRIGVVQLTSTDDVEENLTSVRQWVKTAVEAGANWVALPENFAYMRREGEPVESAQDLEGTIVQSVAQLARSHRIWILGGSFAERIPGDDRVYNTSFLMTPGGDLAAVYRKIHLFDVDLGSEGGGRFCESATYRPGKDVVVADTPFGGIGLSICYDLRFPELYRAHASRDAHFLCIPSAFAPATGRDHWEVLLRARAIENQAFVVAPAQCGAHSPTRSSYGRAMIVDPWGVILASVGDHPGLGLADCDPERLATVRKSVPALTHRRLSSPE